MALGDPYVTLAEMRAYLKIEPERTEMNPRLEAAIAAASRFVDRHCHRQFNKADTATEREFKLCGPTLYVDDFYTTDSLVVAGKAWATDDYTLLPLNGVYEGKPGRPFFRLSPPERLIDDVEEREQNAARRQHRQQHRVRRPE